MNSFTSDETMLEFITKHMLKTSNPRSSFLIENRTRDCLNIGSNQKTLLECGEFLKISRERVRQHCAKINRKVKIWVDNYDYDSADDRVRIKIVEKNDTNKELSKVYLIDKLPLTTRTATCLLNAGIKTMENLLEKSQTFMKAQPNLGMKSLNELKEILTAKGYGKEVYPEAPFWMSEK